MSAFTEVGKPDGFRNHLTIAELSRFLGVSDRTIERWYAKGVIPPPALVTEAGWKLWSPAQATVMLRRCRENKSKSAKIAPAPYREDPNLPSALE